MSSNCGVARWINVRMIIRPFGDNVLRFSGFSAIARFTSSSRPKDFEDQPCFRTSSAATGHRPHFARKCPDQACEPPLVNDKSIRLGEQDLVEIYCTVAITGEKVGRHLRSDCKHNADLRWGYLREGCRKLGRPDETAGEHDHNRRFPEDCLADMPDPIAEEHPSAPGWNDREYLFQPIEKPFSIEAQTGEIIVVVVDPAGFWAEVTRLPSQIQLDRRVVILIAGPAPNRPKCGTRF
jgi:hypothetical protein